ncbi:MAG: putative rane spanning protein [Gammaproteobacteria bacterium]|jgi:hypothetical protein|nr:putative rane spanning protein [Gammaproteobacteria bacterium]
MLRWFGVYLIEDPKHAAWVALLLGLLSLLGLLPLLFVGYILLALIVLHEGPKIGLLILSVLLAPPIVLGFALSSPFPIALIVQGLTIWLLAWALRSDMSWPTVLLMAALIGLLSVIVFHLWVGDAAEWWRTQLAVFWQRSGTLSFMGISSQELRLAINKMSSFITGIFVSSLFLYSTAILLLARGWQALLFNPGGLKKEFLAIYIPKVASIGLLFCMGAAVLGFSIAQDVLAIFFVPFMVAGISLVHVMAERKKEASTLMLACFYIAFLFFFPYVTMALVLIGFLDSWFHFRSWLLIQK